MTLSMTSSDAYDARLEEARKVLSLTQMGRDLRAKQDASAPIPCHQGYRYSDAQIERVLESLRAAAEAGHIRWSHDGNDPFVSDWYRGTGGKVPRNWVVKVYYPSRNKRGSAIWCSGFSTLDAIVNQGALKERPIVSSYDPDEEETETQYLLRTETPEEIICPYCKQMTRLVDSAEIYKGRSYGLAYWCDPCDAYVGCHKGTARSLGTPANEPLRDARKEAHKNFDPLWKETDLTRKCAYAWLASKMGMRKWDCHIAKFNIEDCNIAVFHCMDELVRLGVRKDPEHGFARDIDELGFTNEREE